MRLLDARRLTGPNLQTRRPAAAAEVVFDPGEDSEAALAAFEAEAGRMLGALGLGPLHATRRVWPGGAMVTAEVPIDALYGAVAALEWAAKSAETLRETGEPLPLDPAREGITAELAKERNPALLELQAEAARRGVPFAWDDDEVSLGMGRSSRTFPARALPAPESLDWSAFGAIPVALVTGTNGKTTTSRLLARIVREAGLKAGNTTTDGIVVDGTLVEAGDWTGPGAARQVLRRHDVEIAVLETARGGILRRGLAVDACEVAVLTNVSADHLGEYGILDVAGMARAKAVVGSVVRPEGRVVICADDPELMALADSFPAPVVLFGLDPDAPVVRDHQEGGGEAWLVADGQVVHATGRSARPLLPAADVACSFGGAARYNLRNALAAAAAASALGLPEAAIIAGLKTFGTSRQDNPGRAEVIEVEGIRVLIDFGHNAHGLSALLDLLDHLRGDGRLFVIAAQAGDRSDADLAELSFALVAARPHRVLLRDLVPYLRGRAMGEVPEVMRRACLDAGLSDEAVAIVDSEVAGLARAFGEARPGDLVVLLIHVEHEAVEAFLAGFGARSA
jgi:cyanophycin synthetase